MSNDQKIVINQDKDSREFNLAYHNTILENISSQFKVFGEAQIALTEKVDGIDEKLGALTEKVNIIDAKLDVLTERVNILEQKVNILIGRMDKVEGRLDGIEMELKEIKEQLNIKVSVEEYNKLEQRVVHLEKLVAM